MNGNFSEDQISLLMQKVPKYLYIKFALMNKIKSGELKIGDQLPTEKELCESFNCSRLTVRKALEELLLEGYIYKIQGRGAFIRDRMPTKQNLDGIKSCSTLILSQNMIPTKKILMNKIINCDQKIAEKLSLKENDKVLEYERVYYGDGVPVIYGHSFFNAEKLQGIEKYDLKNQSIISLLKEKYNMDIQRRSRDLKAVAANDSYAQLLNVPKDFPLLNVMDVKCGISENIEVPVEYGDFLYVTERIKYSPEIG